MNGYIPYVFGSGIALVVIGAVIARGDVRSYGLSNEDLVVNLDGITVGAIHYPMRMVGNMNFNVEAYNGMYVNDGAMVSGSNSDGMTNSLTLSWAGRKWIADFFCTTRRMCSSWQRFSTSSMRGISLSWSGIAPRVRICSRC